MGLDQYAIALEDAPDRAVDFDLDLDESEIFFRWRKHPNLHGFIRDIYQRKGGGDWQWGEFAGPVVLDKGDLDAIEKATKEGTLPVTEGFFFGQSRPEDRERTLRFVDQARTRMSLGDTIAYMSSW